MAALSTGGAVVLGGMVITGARAAKPMRASDMNWTDSIDVYGELGARALEQVWANAVWREYVEGAE